MGQYNTERRSQKQHCNEHKWTKCETGNWKYSYQGTDVKQPAWQQSGTAQS